MVDSGAGLDLLVQTIRHTIDGAPEEYRQWAHQLAVRVDRLVEVTEILWRDGVPELALANATLYLEATGHVVLAWIWLDQVRAADGRRGTLYDGKRAAARYFFTYELPRVDAQFDILADLDTQLLELDPDCL